MNISTKSMGSAPSEAEKSEIEHTCRAHALNTMISAFREMQCTWPDYGIELNPAMNAGVVYGLADLLTQVIVGSAADPDWVARKIAEHIQTEVAMRTSGGEA